MNPNTSTPSSTKKGNSRRRRVADDIQEKQPESVKSLLAALEKAQKTGGSESPRVSVIEPSKPEAESSRKTSKAEPKVIFPKQTACGSRSNRTRHNSHHEGRQRQNSNSATAGPSKTSQKQNHPKGPSIPRDILNDLEFRFITSIPDHEKFVNTRVCFQIELAHWFYVDYFANKDNCDRQDCPNMGMRDFTRQMFYHCSELSHLSGKVDAVLEEWRFYKSNVPTYGAILLDSTLNKVLLVQGFYSSKNSWGFPKGKVNENEEPRKCAIREVYEETGFDFSETSPGKEHKIQKFINDTMVRLYIVKDVPTDFPFAPRTRNEIRRIEWFNVWDLPTDKNDQVHRMGPLSNNNFYTVIPFVNDMQSYIRKEQAKRAKLAKREEAKPDPFTVSVQSISSNSANNDVLSSLFKMNYSAPVSSSPVVPPPPLPLAQFTSPSLVSVTSPAHIQPTAPISSSSLVPDLFNQSDPMVLFAGMKQPSTSNGSNFSQSPFRPVDDMAQTLLNIVKPATSTMRSPQIAHPIAIQARGKLPSIDGSDQDIPAPRKQRISISETSAFKLIPQSKSNSSLRSAGTDSELNLNSSFNQRSPQVVSSVPRPARPPPSVSSPQIQLCDAWKDFQLDMTPFVEFFRSF